MLVQLIHIINLFTLLLSTTGILVHQHYCQDKLKTLSFYTETTTKNCCKKHKTQLSPTTSCNFTSPQINKKPCCENKTLLSIDNSAQQLPVVEDGLVSTWNLTLVPVVYSFVEHTMEQQFLLDKNKQLRYYSCKAPPNKVPLHLLFCSFCC